MDHSELFGAFAQMTQPHQIDSAECNRVLAELYLLNTYKHALNDILSTADLPMVHIMQLSDMVNDLTFDIIRWEKKLDHVFLLKHI